MLNRIKEVIRINLSVRIVGHLFTWERIPRNVIMIIVHIADHMLRTVSMNETYKALPVLWWNCLC